MHTHTTHTYVCMVYTYGRQTCQHISKTIYLSAYKLVLMHIYKCVFISSTDILSSAIFHLTMCLCAFVISVVVAVIKVNRAEGAKITMFRSGKYLGCSHGTYEYSRRRRRNSRSCSSNDAVDKSQG